MAEKMIFSAVDNWQLAHDLPTGAILVDDGGNAYQVSRYRDEVWLCPAADEYAFIVKSDGPELRSYLPQGNLTLVWTP